MSGPARLEVELDREGRHFGELYVPWSRDASAYGRLSVPVVVVRGGAGPTLLVSAGIHGDEYEGQLALRRLAQQIDPKTLSGRLIFVPTANPPASVAARRTSPVDGENLARIFPGKPDGSLSQQLAEGLTRLLLPLSDALLDLHSGGSTLEYLPCAFGRLPSDPALARRCLAMIMAFGAPEAMLMRSPEASGTFVSTALAQGLPAMASELGGGGTVLPQTLDLAKKGVLNVAAHMGILPQPGPAAKSRLLGISGAHFLRAPQSGLFEPAVSLGQTVHEGEVAGWLWQAERPELAPEPLHFGADGIVVCRRVPVTCEKSDVLFHLAEPITEAELIPLAS